MKKPPAILGFLLLFVMLFAPGTVGGGMAYGAQKEEYVTTRGGRVYPASRMIYHKSRLQKIVRVKKEKNNKRILTYRLPGNFSSAAKTSAGTHSSRDEPKLVIIIDDIATYTQWKRLRSIPYEITPSIFPPSKNVTIRASMISDPEHAMIHLPMEAKISAKNTMCGSICIKDTTKLMEQRIKKLRHDLPGIRIINNHTGSALTSDYDSFYRLYGIMKCEGFIFVDSYTSVASKASSVAAKYGDKCLVRDVFLDNVRTRPAIRAQLQKAVKIARTKGYAIAIGHPHDITMGTLRGSGDILRGVRVIYMDRLLKELGR